MEEFMTPEAGGGGVRGWPREDPAKEMTKTTWLEVVGKWDTATTEASKAFGI
jgi:hypothetical protein